MAPVWPSDGLFKCTYPTGTTKPGTIPDEISSYSDYTDKTTINKNIFFFQLTTIVHDTERICLSFVFFHNCNFIYLIVQQTLRLNFMGKRRTICTFCEGLFYLVLFSFPVLYRASGFVSFIRSCDYYKQLFPGDHSLR